MILDQLQNLSIFEIRAIARNAGIIPGTRRKQEIIDDIIAVKEGKITPTTEKKHGRPPKTFAMTNFLTHSPSSEIFPEQGNIVFNNDTTINFKYGDVLEVTGTLQIKDNKTAQLWERENFHFNRYNVPMQLVIDYNLKQGDKLFVCASASSQGSVVKAIYRINDLKINEQPAVKNYNEVTHTHPTKNITNNLNLNLKFGETYFVNGENNNQTTTSLANLLNACNADYKIYINCTVAEKNKLLLTELGNDVEQFVSSMADGTNIAKEIVILAIERAKRIFETGKNCLVVVDDLPSIIGLAPEDNLLARKLIDLTKNSEDGSISVVAAVNDNKYCLPFLKLADARFNIIDGQIK